MTVGHQCGSQKQKDGAEARAAELQTQERIPLGPDHVSFRVPGVPTCGDVTRCVTDPQKPPPSLEHQKVFPNHTYGDVQR